MILDFLCVYIHVFVPSCCVLIVFYITFFPSLQPFYVKSLSLMFSFFISCLTFVCLVSLNPPVYAPDTLLCNSSLLLVLCLVICCLSLFLLLYLYLFASIISLYPQRKLFVVPGFWCFPFYFVSLLDLTTGLLINDSL